MKEKSKFQRTINKKNEDHRNLLEEVSEGIMHNAGGRGWGAIDAHFCKVKSKNNKNKKIAKNCRRNFINS